MVTYSCTESRFLALNNKGKAEVHRTPDRSMVSSQAGTNLCLFVLVLQDMTSNILNNKGTRKFIGPQTGRSSSSYQSE